MQKTIAILSYLIGFIFILSGITKILSLENFANEVALYGDSYINFSFIVRYREILAFGLCVFEIIIGVISVIKHSNILTTIITTLLLLFFVYLTGCNYFIPAYDQGIASCGCFGDFINLTPGWAFAKSSLLFIVSLTKLMLCFNLLKT